MASASVVFRNLPVIKQSLIAIIGNTSIFVKFVCISVIIGYGLSFSNTAIDVLSVTPGYLLPPTFWLWTAFTHCFVEVHFWQVCADIITLGLCGKLVEPLWGGFEMVLFFLLVNISVAFISAFFYLFIYMCTFNPDVLFTVHIHGMAGYIAGLSVVVKQIMPDHVLFHTRTPLGKITNRNVPLNLFLIALILYGCNLLEGLYATMIGCGILVSWVYLRFYQVHTNGTRGDMADNFTFASFLPNVLQPPMMMLSNTVYSCLVRMRVCRKPVRKYDVGAPTAISISLPGMDPSDAERRRQKALRLLSERLSQHQQQPTDGSNAWPSMEDSPASRVHSPTPPRQTSMADSPTSAASTSSTSKTSKSVTISLPPEGSHTATPQTSTTTMTSSVSSESGPATATLVDVDDSESVKS